MEVIQAKVVDQRTINEKSGAGLVKAGTKAVSSLELLEHEKDKNTGEGEAVTAVKLPLSFSCFSSYGIAKLVYCKGVPNQDAYIE